MFQCRNSSITENTIASFREAAERGASMVEFDVQLTRDMVPIVYHDFRVCVRSSVSNQLIKVFVKDLTLTDIQDLKLEPVSELRLSHTMLPTINFQEITDHLVRCGPERDELPEEFRAFPTLKKVRHSLCVCLRERERECVYDDSSTLWIISVEFTNF